MRRNRYLLCMLLCGWMLYFAEPRLQLFNSGIEGVFAISWTFFAMLVMAGNLSGLLYSQNQRKNHSRFHQKRQSKKKIRSFH